MVRLANIRMLGIQVWQAPGWPEMSTRYDAPTGRSGANEPGSADDRPRTDAELWKALDEGRDPTV